MRENAITEPDERAILGTAKRGKEERIAQLLLWLGYRDARTPEKAVSIDDIPESLADVVKPARRLGLVRVVENKVFLSEDAVAGTAPKELISFFRMRVIIAGILVSVLSILLTVGIITLILPGVEIPIILLIVLFTLAVALSLIYIDYRRTLG